MRKPIGEVLQGVEVRPLDEGDVALEVFAIIKTMDRNGEVCWVERSTEGPHQFEFLGALTAAVARVQATCMENWIADEDED